MAAVSLDSEKASQAAAKTRELGPKIATLAALGADATPAQAQELADLRAQEIAAASAASAPISDGFWSDLVSDKSGPTVPKFQVILWTAILSAIFVTEVASQGKMKDFDTTQLVLLGISSGTYLGFKFPEKKN